MIYSMTGFGQAEKTIYNEKVVVEVRSINSKTIDINTRIPHIYKAREIDIKNLISKKMIRGKVDLSIYVEKPSAHQPPTINKTLVEQYIGILRTMAKAEDIEYLKMAIAMPETLKPEIETFDEEKFSEVKALIEQATQNAINFRKQEGEALERDVLLRIQNIKNALSLVSQFDKSRIEAIRTKFDKCFRELRVDVDTNRLEQELIYYIEKLDITEEQVRLKNHLDYFVDVARHEEQSGRKLGFICQEIGREINTIGSKSNHTDMQKCVVEMKDELEKIKEQILNII